MGRIRRLAVAAVLGWLVMTAAAASGALAFSPVVVKNKPNPVKEFSPAASADFFAWSQNSTAHVNVYNVYAQPIGGGAAVRVNVPDSVAWGTGISGTRLAYGQAVLGKSFDIRFFNLARHTHSNPPPGVNTPGDETFPTISGNWMLFTRLRNNVYRVLLYNLATHSVRVLATQKNQHFSTSALGGEVNGNWATYTICKLIGGNCAVYRYDIAANKRTRIARPAGRSDLMAAVAADGTLYINRSGNSCGKAETITELPVGGPATTIHSFSPGVGVVDLQVVNDGTNDILYYTRYACNTAAQDIYKSIVG